MKWNDKLNKRYTLISIYVIITAIIIYSLTLVAKNAPSILGDIMDKLNWIAKVAKPILFAFIIAYLLNPVNEFFESQYKKIKIGKKQLKSPRTWAVLTTILIIIAILAGIISLLVFSVTNQIRLANSNDIMILAQSYLQTINDFYYSALDKLNDLNIQSEEITQYVKTATAYLANSLKEVANSLIASLSNLSSYLTTFLFSTIIGIYFMIDTVMIKGFLRKVGNAILNDKWYKKTEGFLVDADNVFSGYIRGQLTDAAVMMILISLSLSVIGVKFALIIGILAGIGNLVPYLGPFVAYFSTVLVCLINGQYKELLIALITLFIIQTIDGNIIAPKLLSDSIEIHPVLVIISLIFGSAMGGFVGMLIAVPVGALVKLLFVRYIDYRLEKKAADEAEEKLEIKVENKIENKKVKVMNKK